MLFARKNIFGLIFSVFPLLAAGGIFFALPVFSSSVDLTLTVTSGVAVCGNGIIETGEQCDNGASNGVCSAACSASCTTNSCGSGTVEVTPPLAISALAAADIAAVSANINWITNREAICSLQYGIDTAYASSTIAETVSTTAHSIALSGLSSSTAYHYKINCTDNLSMSAATGDNTFSTLAEAPPLQPLVISGIAVAGITKDSASINWTTGRPAICGVRWGVNTDYAGGASSEIDFLSSHISPLAGLAPNTTYHYIIDCHDSSDIAASSGDKTFKTLLGPDLDPPGNVIGLRTQSGNGTSTLFWRKPADPDYAGVVIRRSTVYYPSFSQGSAVYDGQGSLAGGEFSFPDSGLTNGIIYYYTVFAYDLSRNYAAGAGIVGTPLSGIQPPETCATNPALCPPPPEDSCATNPALCPPPPGYVGDLFFSDFNFFQQGRLLAIGADNRVTAQTDNPITVSLPESKALVNTDKIVLNMSVGGKMETYLLAYDASSKSYSASLSAIKDSGIYYASIILLNAANQSLKVISGSIEIRAPEVEIMPSAPAVVDAAVSAVANIAAAVRENPTVRAISEVAATPAGQSAAAASVAVSFATTAISIPLLNWWFLLQFIFTQPLKLLWFRKGWGTVYNAITKKPVDLALVRLYDAKTDRLLASRVTDKNGRYIFLVNPGEYYIKIEKAGFEYPSALLKHAHDDGSYLDLYYGEKIVISGEERSAIIANIPIDQEDARLTDAEVLRRYSKARLSQSLSYLGPALAIVYFLFYPSIFSIALVAVHFLMLFLFRRLAGRKHKKHWGVVFAPDGKSPVKRAITRIFSSEYGRMLEFYVTDDQGRYDFLVGNNKYYVTADKPGYGTAKTGIVDLTGKKPEELVIAQDLVLPAHGTGTESAPPVSPAEAAPPKEIVEMPPSLEPAAEKAAQPEAPEEITAIAPDTAVEVKDGEEENVEPTLSVPPEAHSLDLGSIDEIREQMEGGAEEPVAAAPEPEPEAEPETPPDKPGKADEGIYG